MRRQRRGGSIAVEAALILPLLLLLVFGVLEYGWAFTKSGQIVNAARQGARVGVRADATQQEVLDAVTALMERANLGDSGYTVTISPGDVELAATGEPISVEVSVPYANIRLTGFPLPTPSVVSGEASMAKEGT